METLWEELGKITNLVPSINLEDKVKGQGEGDVTTRQDIEEVLMVA